MSNMSESKIIGRLSEHIFARTPEIFDNVLSSHQIYVIRKLEPINYIHANLKCKPHLLSTIEQDQSTFPCQASSQK